MEIFHLECGGNEWKNMHFVCDLMQNGCWTQACYVIDVL